jgi:hypothetical protein
VYEEYLKIKHFTDMDVNGTLSKPVHEKYLRMIFLQIWTSMTLSKPVYEEYLRIKHFTDIDINDTL